MKLIYRVIVFVTFTGLFNSCDLFWLDEGGYEYEGVVVDSVETNPLSGVACSMFIENELHAEHTTDSTGTFRLLWSGVISKNDARITFSKDEYKTIEMHASMGNNDHFNDTVFMEKFDIE
jgi:hypothetical protein